MKRSLLSLRPHRGAAVIRAGAWSAAIGALLLSFAVVGCAGSLDPGVTGNGGGGGGGASGAPCQDMIFANKCAGCHFQAGPAAGLDLQTADQGSRMLNKMTGIGSVCPNQILLNPNSNPATGVFIDKIVNTTPACGGSQMPQGGTLTKAELTCLTTWATGVTTGAP